MTGFESDSYRRPRRKDEGSAVAVWKEKEFLKGKLLDAGVIILRTGGCSHFHNGGCSMCGYNTESKKGISAEQIVKQFERALPGMGDVQVLKVYTSGSFLDKTEVPEEAARRVLEECSSRGMRLLVESRPEYVTGERVDEILSMHGNLEIAIGFESANDKVLKYSINKGFTVADYDKAADILKERNVDLRSYVLIKPPFLTEAEAIADAVATVRHAAKTSTTISINAVNVQKGTVVDKLWRNWAYRPPWLWSVLQVVRESEGLGAKVVCDPVGGGSIRGAHNCGECDQIIIDGLKDFSISQNWSRLGSKDCSCKDMWNMILDIEGLVTGGTCDLQRFFRPQRR
ncbi:MAG: archaeosine biosynthesis radical SAM protein RaSEA [Thermoplasmata archaeon]|nr:archaeosine biosynthesis radical SAM protein RaSEA [Thermoplasmata archaeon]TFG70459.1 MAG: TIGR01210 family radical SAM protein [Methanomassiliicoccus sp.]